MKNAIIVCIALAIAILGCFEPFDKDRFRFSGAIKVSNLKDTLNIGDTLFFSASLPNSITITDVSKNRKPTFIKEFNENLKLKVIWGVLGPVVNPSFPGLLEPTGSDKIFDTFDYLSQLNIISEPGIIPFEFKNNTFQFDLKIVPKKKGLYRFMLQDNYINTKTVTGEAFEGTFFPFFSTQHRNRHLLVEIERSMVGYDEEHSIMFYVK